MEFLIGFLIEFLFNYSLLKDQVYQMNLDFHHKQIVKLLMFIKQILIFTINNSKQLLCFAIQIIINS